MKKIIFSIIALVTLTGFKSFAQMAMAQPSKWDVSKGIEIAMETDSAWAILNNPEQLVNASNGYLKAIEIIDANKPVIRKVILSNGNSRIEDIVQNEAHNKLMVVSFTKTSLPKGINAAEYAIFLKYKGDLCSITWKAKIEGNNEAKKILMAELTTEFDNYAIGFEKLTRKSIPATKMN